MIYQIKIINTSNNTRILLISSSGREVYSTNFNQSNLIYGVQPSYGLGLRDSGNYSNRRHKMLFQLSSGQLGFKGATRKSSFVISKLIQLFFNRINILIPNFRYIPCNIYFLGPRNNYSVIMDQIRLGIRSWPALRGAKLNNLSFASSSLARLAGREAQKDNSFNQSTKVAKLEFDSPRAEGAGRDNINIFNLPSLPRPSVNFNNTFLVAPNSKAVLGLDKNDNALPPIVDLLSPLIPANENSRRIYPAVNKIFDNNYLSGIKIFDITPIPFNGCKLKKSRRK